MQQLHAFVGTVNTYLVDYVLVFVLTGTGLFYTLRLGFLQVRKFGTGFRQTFGGMFRKKEPGEAGGISSFQALATAIAAQVGTGNLAGAATAIALGGAGAIFWMWVSAFLGMATIYAEAVLAQRFNTEKDGQLTGGPVYYIRAAFRGTGGRVLAAAFAVLLIFALGFIGNAVQANSIGDAFRAAFGLPPVWVGVGLALVAFFIFSGGLQRIASVTQTLVPIMAFFYIAGAVYVIAVNFRNIPSAFSSIFVGAFSPQSVVGGVAGVTVQRAMRYGVARGLFSNEAGMGSTPHAHAVARVRHASEQGYVAMMGVFIDTYVILTMTALVILTSGVLRPDGSLLGTALTQAAFSSALGSFGTIFIAICMLFFAFSTIIGWYFFGEINVKYLLGSKAVKPYAILVCAFLILGSVLRVQLVWDLADLLNGLMVIPNLLALVALSGLVAKLSRERR